MPERLDHVTITTRRTTIQLPLESRDALLHEIRHLESGKSVVAAFEAVGATRPVGLTPDGQALLISAIDVMTRNAGDPALLPPGIFDLRNALIDELHDAGAGP